MPPRGMISTNAIHTTRATRNEVDEVRVTVEINSPSTMNKVKYASDTASSAPSLSHRPFETGIPSHGRSAIDRSTGMASGTTSPSQAPSSLGRQIGGARDTVRKHQLQRARLSFTAHGVVGEEEGEQATAPRLR